MANNNVSSSDTVYESLHSDSCTPSQLLGEQNSRISTACAYFRPRPYTFHVKDALKKRSNGDATNAYVRCPDFHVILDHTIAVLWMSFADDQDWTQLKPSQVQWAKKFLEGIKNKNGQNSTDVKMAINRMNEMTFKLYTKSDSIAFDESTNNAETSDKAGNISISLNDMFQNSPELIKRFCTKTQKLVSYDI